MPPRQIYYHLLIWHLSDTSDTVITSGLKERRSAVVGRIVDLRREIDRLRADLYHVELKKADVAYAELARQLNEHGFEGETEGSVNSTLVRETFAVTLFWQPWLF